MIDERSGFVSIRNRRGVFVFLLLALAFVFIPRILMSLRPDPSIELKAEEVRELRNESARQLKKFDNRFKKKQPRKYSPPITRFDPNTYTKADWMKLGLSSKQADVVLSFAKRRIRSNEELSRIFVIPEELYELIKDSTYYPEKMKTSKSITININVADQIELEKIPGVGPFYAKNILKYRERLGGFVKKDQLLEVWKMDVEKYNAIEMFVEVQGNQVRKITLNTATAEELKSHPYLNWNIANSIVKIRVKKGKFTAIDDIRESVLIDEELFEKIKPYLSL